MPQLSRRYHQVHLDVYQYLAQRQQNTPKVNKFLLNYESETPRLTIFEQVEAGKPIAPVTPLEPLTPMKMTPFELTTPPNSAPQVINQKLLNKHFLNKMMVKGGGGGKKQHSRI